MATIGELMLLWDIRDELKRANDIVEEERVKREWEKWDKEYKEGTINELKNVQTAGLQTAKALGTTKERLISAIESGEIKIVSIIEPNVVAEIPTKMIWTDASRKEAQRDEYKQYLNEVMDLIGKYQHRIIS